MEQNNRIINRYKLLTDWVGECICTSPKIINGSNSPAEVYRQLYELWADDCQKALKSVILEAQGRKRKCKK